MADTVEQKETKPQPVAKGRQYIWGTGRRKSSVARVRIAEGAGAITVNDRAADRYFSELQDRQAVAAPLDLLEQRGKYDVLVNVSGGGVTGQAFAIRLGLSRAMAKIFPEKEVLLRDAGFLTRDSRMKERKKYGQKGARKRFQFSKR